MLKKERKVIDKVHFFGVHKSVSTTWLVIFFLLLLNCQFAVWHSKTPLKLAFQQENALNGQMVAVLVETYVRNGKILWEIKLVRNPFVCRILVKV